MLVEDGVAHVGEDAGEEAVLLERDLPGNHGGIDGGPHAGVGVVEFVYGRGGEVEIAVAEELFPEGDAGEFAFVVGVAVGPVERFELLDGKAGDADHLGVGVRVGESGEHHSVIEDHRAQSQCFLLTTPMYGEKGAPVSIVPLRGADLWTRSEFRGMNDAIFADERTGIPKRVSWRGRIASVCRRGCRWRT